MSLNERALEIHSMWGVDVSRTLLATVYRRHRVSKTKCKYYTRNAWTKAGLHSARVAFSAAVASLLRDGHEILYFDESSLNAWERASTVWQPIDNKLFFELPGTQGRNFTIMGALSSKRPEFYYRIVETTNRITVAAFLSEGIPESADIRFIQYDNHPAHWTNEVLEAMTQKRLLAFP